MKIAITAGADGWKEKLEERFGRTMGIFVCNTDNGETTYLDNRLNADAGHGAGTSTAQSIINAGVDVVITGRIGPKAGAALKAGGVKVFVCENASTIKEAYERFRSGELEEANE